MLLCNVEGLLLPFCQGSDSLLCRIHGRGFADVGWLAFRRWRSLAMNLWVVVVCMESSSKVEEKWSDWVFDSESVRKKIAGGNGAKNLS